MAEKKTFSSKFKALFTGKRPFQKRLLLALGPSLALSFTLLFFGPLDLSYISRDYVTYSALDILPQTAVIMGTAFLALLLAASIPGGKVHAFLISVYSGLSLAFYLQGAFLNPDLGTLDGHTINWPSFSTKMVINLAIWFLILLIPHLVHYFSNRIWQRFVILISAALILMQAGSLAGKLLDQAKIDRDRPVSWYLSTENMLKTGSEKNITVFLLDTVSNSDITAMVEKFPEQLNVMHDFTMYTNANSHYMFTVPSLVNLLTGQEWDCENESIRDYMNKAWSSDEAESFYLELKNQEFDRNVYLLLSEAANDPAVLKDSFSNLKSTDSGRKINRQAFLKLFKLSCYRYFPIALKPFFVIYTTDISNLLTADDAMSNEWELVSRMNEEGFTAGSAKNVFSFYYLAGTHKPYRIDERGRLISSDLEPKFLTNYSEKEQQLSGFFYLISDYIRQLKENGLYDNTGIIILADHGNNEEAGADHQPIYMIKMPGETHGDMYIRTAPITIQDCFIPDVLSMAGVNENLTGIPSAQVPEEPAERWTRAYAYDESYPPLPGASNNVMREYRYEGDADDLTDKWVSGEYTTIPMLDSFY